MRWICHYEAVNLDKDILKLLVVLHPSPLPKLPDHVILQALSLVVKAANQLGRLKIPAIVVLKRHLFLKQSQGLFAAAPGKAEFGVLLIEAALGEGGHPGGSKDVFVYLTGVFDQVVVFAKLEGVALGVEGLSGLLFDEDVLDLLDHLDLLDKEHPQLRLLLAVISRGVQDRLALLQVCLGGAAVGQESLHLFPRLKQQVSLRYLHEAPLRGKISELVLVLGQEAFVLLKQLERVEQFRHEI